MILLTLLGCAPDFDQNYAMLLVLDGVRVDELSAPWISDLTGVSGPEHAARLWEEVVPEGMVIRSYLNPAITQTAPAHASLLTGRIEEMANFPLPTGPGIYNPYYPNIFEELRRQTGLPDTDAVLMANTTLLQTVTRSLQPDSLGGSYVLVSNDEGDPAHEDADVFNAIEQAIEDGPPRLLVVNLHAADRVGHGTSETAYADYVLAQDEGLADLWRWLKRKHPRYVERLLVAITTDHGRHRNTPPLDWHSHGDSCAGCRQLPLILLGPSVAPNTELKGEGNYLSIDLAPTLAAWLGIQLPWAQGLPIPEVVPDASVRNGDTAISISGALTGVQRYSDDRGVRSRVVLDGEELDVSMAEAPMVLDGENADYACFRSFVVEQSAASFPWVPHCLRRSSSGTGGWEEIGFIEDRVGIRFAPVLFEDGDGLIVVYAHNPFSFGEDETGEMVALRQARWSPTDGWVLTSSLALPFPTAISAAHVPGGYVMAAATNLESPQSPYTRRIRVLRQTGTTDISTTVTDFALEDLLAEPRRVERPAVSADGEHVRLAMIGMDETTSFLAVTESSDGGQTWATPHRLPTDAPPLPHISPQWRGDRLFWAARDDDGAAMMCSLRIKDATPAVPDCRNLLTPRLDSFALTPDAVHVSLDINNGDWTVRVLPWLD